jgi:hypothetical protein
LDELAVGVQSLTDHVIVLSAKIPAREINFPFSKTVQIGSGAQAAFYSVRNEVLSRG